MRFSWICLILWANFVHAKDDDPEIFMNATEIIQHWGYPVEVHTATTSDGYILELHRIPNGKDNSKSWPNGKKPVIFMQHGLLGDSSHFIGNLPSQSAAYLFADAGFDVWLGNMRGNTYSTRHVSMDPSSHAFWKFSWDEMAAYDLEAMIDKALDVSGQSTVYYIGHSQGTLTMLSHLSKDRGGAFTKKIKKFFAWAPISSVEHIEGAFKYLAKDLGGDITLYYELFGAGAFLPQSYLIRLLSDYVCGGLKIEADTCDNFLFLIAGPESQQWNETRVPVYISQMPGGTSSQNMIHWTQQVKDGGIPAFDYGTKENKKKYGQPTPPQYDYSQITGTDVYLYWSDSDWLADTQDINESLLPKIKPPVLKQNNHLPGFNHLDFIWGLNATDIIYKPIIQICTQDYSCPTCL